MTNQEISVDEAQVRAKAFEIWQGRGCPLGSPERDWFAALDVLSASPAAGDSALDEDPTSAPVSVRWLATPAAANASAETPAAPRVAVAANGSGASAPAAAPRAKAKRARRAKR